MRSPKEVPSCSSGNDMGVIDFSLLFVLFGQVCGIVKEVSKKN